MNGTPIDSVSISYPPTNPRLGSLCGLIPDDAGHSGAAIHMH